MLSCQVTLMATPFWAWSVMLNYAGKYCEYCVTVIRSSDAALKSCLEWLTMSYIISDSAYLIFSAVLQTELTWISLEMCAHKQRPVLDVRQVSCLLHICIFAYSPKISINKNF